MTDLLYTNSIDLDEPLLAYIQAQLLGEIDDGDPEYYIDEYAADAAEKAVLIQYQNDVPHIGDDESPIQRQRYMIAARARHPKTAKTIINQLRDLLHRKEQYSIGDYKCFFSFLDGGPNRVPDDDSKLYIYVAYFIFIMKES